MCVCKYRECYKYMKVTAISYMATYSLISMRKHHRAI